MDNLSGPIRRWRQHCITHASPTSWNTLVNASTGLSPFMASLGYQPPLFPELEDEIAVPSVQTHLRRCRRTWKRTRAALLHASSRSRLCCDFRGRRPPTGSLLTHFICFSFRSIIYKAKGEELYNSRVERLLAEYLIDTLPLEFLPPPCLCALDSIREAWPL